MFYALDGALVVWAMPYPAPLPHAAL